MKHKKQVELISELKGGNTHDHRSNGQRTRDELKKRGIVSPSTDNLIEIKAGLRIQAPDFENDFERIEWIERQKLKYAR